MSRWIQGLIALAALPVSGLALSEAWTNIVADSANLDLQREWDSSPHIRVEHAYAKAMADLTRPASVDLHLLTDAKSVLRVNPLNSHALWIVAMSYAEGSQQRIDGLELAEQVNRRDFAVEMQLAKEYALLDDSETALEHLDRVLVVYAANTPELLQRLAGQLGNQQFRQALLTYRDRAWFKQLIDVAIIQHGNPNGIADLILAAGLTGREFKPTYLPILLQDLLHLDAYDKAVAIAIRLGWNRTAAQTFAFTAESVDQRFAPLNWQISGSAPLAALFSGRDQLEVSLVANTAGEVTARYSKLRAGKYVLDLQGILPTESSDIGLTISGLCMSAGSPAQFINQPIKVSASRISVNLNLVIPANCSVQRWQLSANVGEVSDGGKLILGPLSLISDQK